MENMKYQPLEEILNGVQDTWKYFTIQEFQDYLSKFLLPSTNYQGLLDELKRLGPRQVCQYQVLVFVFNRVIIFIKVM